MVLALLALTVYSIFVFSRLPETRELYLIHPAAGDCAGSPAILIYTFDGLQRKAVPAQEVLLEIKKYGDPAFARKLHGVKTDVNGIAMLPLTGLLPGTYTIDAGWRGVKMTSAVNLCASPIKPITSPDCIIPPSATTVSDCSGILSIDRGNGIFTPGDVITGRFTGRRSKSTHVHVVLQFGSQQSEGGMFCNSSNKINILAQSEGNTDNSRPFYFSLTVPPAEKWQGKTGAANLIVTEYHERKDSSLSHTVELSPSPLQLAIMPLEGQMLPSMPREYLIRTSLCNEKPVSAEVTVDSRVFNTDANGLAIYRDSGGDGTKTVIVRYKEHGIKESYGFKPDNFPQSLAVKLDKLVFSPGEDVGYQLYGHGDSGSVWLAFSVNDVNFAMLPLNLNNSYLSGKYKLPDNVSGLVKITAFAIKKSAPPQIISASRNIIVAPPGKARIVLQQHGMIPPDYQSVITADTMPFAGQMGLLEQHGGAEIKIASSASYQDNLKQVQQEKIEYGQKISTLFLFIVDGICLYFLLSLIPGAFRYRWKKQPTPVNDGCLKTVNSLFLSSWSAGISNILVLFFMLMVISNIDSLNSLLLIFFITMFILLEAILSRWQFRLRNQLKRENHDHNCYSILSVPWLQLAMVCGYGIIITGYYFFEYNELYNVALYLFLTLIVCHLLMLLPGSWFIGKSDFKNYHSLGHGLGCDRNICFNRWIIVGILRFVALCLYFIISIMALSWVFRFLECLGG